MPNGPKPMCVALGSRVLGAPQSQAKNEMNEMSSQIKIIVLSLLLTAVSGCAVYNPYISNTDDEATCAAAAQPSPALEHACSKRQDIEEKRAEMVETQNAVASALIPLAGLIGYKGVRGGSQATTAALAAGGAAGYGLSSFLIQQQRFGLYDRAEKALSCAIGLYKVNSVSNSSPPPLVLAQYDSARAKLEQLINSAKAAALTASPTVAASISSAVGDAQQLHDEGEAAIRIAQSSSLLSAKLSQATDRIVSELNTGITNTLQALTTLSQQETTFQ